MSSAVHFLNVGQAHAMVAVNEDSALVVDCPRGGVKSASAVLRQQRYAQFDVVVTHLDLDHCGGIRDLLRSFGNSSTTLYLNPVGRHSPRNRPRVRAVIRSILSELNYIGASAEHAFAGKTGSTGAMNWSVLAPSYLLVLGAALLGGSVNRSSIVLMLEVGGYKFLIPGDIDDVAAGKLLSSGAQLSADVLLLPHHGARLARIGRLLAAVNPRFVVVSAGRRETHPHITTLRAAAAHNCRLMCTQVTHHCHPDPLEPKHCAGSIAFDLSGGSLSVDPSPATHRSRINQLATPVCLMSAAGPTATGTTGAS